MNGPLAIPMVLAKGIWGHSQTTYICRKEDNILEFFKENFPLSSLQIQLESTFWLNKKKMESFRPEGPIEMPTYLVFE